MTWNLGENKVLKEFKISIDSRGRTQGFMDLVSVGGINLEGQIIELNDRNITKSKNRPIELYIKFKNTVKENENFITGSSGFNTPQKYLEGQFKQPQKIKRIKIYSEKNFLHITAQCDSPEYEWRAGERLENMVILEAKNVPGLKDVEKNE
jgi:hypothetical protein